MKREELIAKACETINDVAKNAIAELEKSCMNGTFSMDFSEMENVSGYTAPRWLQFVYWSRKLTRCV